MNKRKLLRSPPHIVSRGRLTTEQRAEVLERVNENLAAEDLCSDLVQKFLYRNPIDGFSGVRLRYHLIVLQLRGLRHSSRRKCKTVADKSDAKSLTSQFSARFASAIALKGFISDLEKAICDYLRDLVVPPPKKPPASPDRKLDDLPIELMKLLALEWINNPGNLRRFLSAILSRWRRHDDLSRPEGQPVRSLYAKRSAVYGLAAEIGPDAKLIFKQLQKRGLIPQISGSQIDSHLAWIRQCLSRDLRHQHTRVYTSRARAPKERGTL